MSSASVVGGTIQEALDAHNKYRIDHGAPPLAWDEKCYQTALVWAQQMAKEDNMYHGGNPGMGQNLAWSSGQDLTWKESVFLWWNEVNDPGYDFTKPQFSMGTGHFTQVVWKGTTHVGMATAKCKSGTYVCANYFPPGNYQGRFAMNVFPSGGIPPSGVMPIVPAPKTTQKPLTKDEMALRKLGMSHLGAIHSAKKAALRLQARVRGKQARVQIQKSIAMDPKKAPGSQSATVPCGSPVGSSAAFLACLEAIPSTCAGWKTNIVKQVETGDAAASATLDVCEGKATLVVKSARGKSTSSIMWQMTMGGG